MHQMKHCPLTDSASNEKNNTRVRFVVWVNLQSELTETAQHWTRQRVVVCKIVIWNLLAFK